MKTKTLFGALILGLSIVACSPKVGENAAKFQSSKSEIDSVSYLIGLNFGGFIKGYNFGSNLNYGQILQGMKDFVNSKGDYRDPDFGKQFKIDPEQMNSMFDNFLKKRRQFVAADNKDKGESFLEKNKAKGGVEVAESGLQYRIIEAGNDVKPAPEDTVWVLYKGTHIDGTVFDQTAEGAEPVQMMLNRVIKGWTEGLQYIGEGGHIELYVPSDLAYGESGNQGIEPNSTLIFDVQLTKVGKYVAPAPVEEEKTAKKK